MTPIRSAFVSFVVAQFLLAATPGHAQELSPSTKRLFDAVWADDIGMVKASIVDGADIGAVNDLGVRAVDLAVDKGHYDIAHYLLSIEKLRAEESTTAAPAQASVPTPLPTVAPTAQPAPAPAPVAVVSPSPLPDSSGAVQPAPAAPPRTPVSQGDPQPKHEALWNPGADNQTANAPNLTVVGRAEPQPVAPEPPTPPAVTETPAQAEARTSAIKPVEEPGLFDRVTNLFSSSSDDAPSSTQAQEPKNDLAADKPAVNESPRIETPAESAETPQVVEAPSVVADTNTVSEEIAKAAEPADPPASASEATSEAGANEQTSGFFNQVAEFLKGDDTGQPDTGPAVEPVPDPPAETAAPSNVEPEQPAETAAAEIPAPLQEREASLNADKESQVPDVPEADAETSPASSVPETNEEASGNMFGRVADLFRSDEASTSQSEPAPSAVENTATEQPNEIASDSQAKADEAESGTVAEDVPTSKASSPAESISPTDETDVSVPGAEASPANVESEPKAEDGGNLFGRVADLFQSEEEPPRQSETASSETVSSPTVEPVEAAASDDKETVEVATALTTEAPAENQNAVAEPLKKEAQSESVFDSLAKWLRRDEPETQPDPVDPKPELTITEPSAPKSDPKPRLEPGQVRVVRAPESAPEPPAPAKDVAPVEQPAAVAEVRNDAQVLAPKAETNETSETPEPAAPPEPPTETARLPVATDESALQARRVKAPNTGPSVVNPARVVEPMIASAALKDVVFALGAEGTLGGKLADDQVRKNMCVDKSRWNTHFCIEPLTWPTKVAESFGAESSIYRGEKSIAQYVDGRRVQLHVLFPAKNLWAVTEHFKGLYGPPTEMPEVWTALIGEPKRPNRVLRWHSRDSKTGAESLLEIREIDDLRWSAPPDTKHGVVRLLEKGQGSVFQLLSSTDLLLVSLRKRGG